jgi:uncharacterized membrane protein YdjX (TVP38/TMEM64 family)
MEKRHLRITMNVITAFSIIACLFFFIYGINTKLFYSEAALEDFLGQFGKWAPIIFIFFQALQVIFPIAPGGIGLLGGALFFGPLMGFFYNYIGICAGSIAAFLISKKYGMAVIQSIFSPKLLKKYMGWTDNKKFNTLFGIAIFMPIAPDDFLCYLAGTTKMKFMQFVTIIILGKPLAIAIYSFGLNVVWKQVAVLIQ